MVFQVTAHDCVDMTYAFQPDVCCVDDTICKGLAWRQSTGLACHKQNLASNNTDADALCKGCSAHDTVIVLYTTKGPAQSTSHKA